MTAVGCLLHELSRGGCIPAALRASFAFTLFCWRCKHLQATQTLSANTSAKQKLVPSLVCIAFTCAFNQSKGCRQPGRVSDWCDIAAWKQQGHAELSYKHN